GQIVKVKVLEVDVKRQRIALTMRLADEFGAAAAPRSGGGAQQDRGGVGRSGSGGRGAPQQRSREPEAGGAMAAAFAKLKQK
ncbi:RNA-binding transcriptional accessory protein, partial [Burkholderia sp. SIMBA_019]